MKVTTAPGGGDPALRDQLKILKEFIEGFGFIRMKPHNEVIKGGKVVSAGVSAAADVKKTARVLAEPGKAYAIYINSGHRAELALELPAGSYKVEWVNTKTGSVDKAELLQYGGGETRFVSPEYVDDIALRLLNQKQ